MCSSDSCSSEILGLGKHVCYADSRTTNFTRLTSPPSVRLRTAARTYFLSFYVMISIPIWLHGLSVDVFCASPSLKLWPLRFQFKRHQLDLINKLKSVFWFNWCKVFTWNKETIKCSHALVGGKPEGEDPTLGSHADEFTNYQCLALTVQPSVIQNYILLYVGGIGCVTHPMWAHGTPWNWYVSFSCLKWRIVLIQSPILQCWEPRSEVSRWSLQRQRTKSLDWQKKLIGNYFDHWVDFKWRNPFSSIIICYVV